LKGVRRRIISADHNVAARFRALKRLAIQGHDADREQEFFAREVQAARFAADWPWPKPFWRRQGWGGVSRYWFGWLYELFGGLGRSVVSPFLCWVAITAD
jgi:hypothetical protein